MKRLQANCLLLQKGDVQVSELWRVPVGGDDRRQVLARLETADSQFKVTAFTSLHGRDIAAWHSFSLSDLSAGRRKKIDEN